MVSGCAYGKVTREKVDNLIDRFDEFRDEIRTEFKDLRDMNSKLYNHLSSRLPIWATGLITGLVAIIGFLSKYVFDQIMN